MKPHLVLLVFVRTCRISNTTSRKGSKVETKTIKVCMLRFGLFCRSIARNSGDRTFKSPSLCSWARIWAAAITMTAPAFAAIPTPSWQGVRDCVAGHLQRWKSAARITSKNSAMTKPNPFRRLCSRTLAATLFLPMLPVAFCILRQQSDAVNIASLHPRARKRPARAFAAACRLRKLRSATRCRQRSRYRREGIGTPTM